MEETIILYSTENTTTVSNHKVTRKIYSGDLRLRPPYIHTFSEDFCGLLQPLQANTGHLLHKNYGHFPIHSLQMIFNKIVMRSRDWIFKHNWSVSVFKGRGYGSVSSLSLRRTGVDPRQFHVRLVIHIIAARIGLFPEYHSMKTPSLNLHITLTKGTNRRSLKFHKSSTLPEMWNHWIDR
jgi:hypothetical protein